MGFFSRQNRCVLFFSLLISALFSTFVSPFANSAPVSLDDWTLAPLQPEFIDEDQIVGKFTFTKDSGDAETRGGGACLVADLNDNFPCETQQDCLDAAEAGLIKPVGEEGFFYCEPLDGQGLKRCWTKPSDESCDRNPFRLPGSYETHPIPALVDGEKVMWITLACLAVAENNFGCASGDPSMFVVATSPALLPEPDEVPPPDDTGEVPGDDSGSTPVSPNFPAISGASMGCALQNLSGELPLGSFALAGILSTMALFRLAKRR